MTTLSILDLVRVTEDTDARGALDNARDLAVHAEAWGYRRIWVAEHHNMPGIASAATSVVIGHIAAGTKTIRVGAGGIMLPNHAPYVIAEQFGTWPDCFQAALTLGWAAHSGPTSSRCALCAARLTLPKTSRRTCLRCRPSWLQLVLISVSGPCRRQERKCRCGFWDRVILVRCWRLNSGFPMPSLLISLPNC
jgi:Luciferase-like monooxygenase